MREANAEDARLEPADRLYHTSLSVFRSNGPAKFPTARPAIG